MIDVNVGSVCVAGIVCGWQTIRLVEMGLHRSCFCYT